MNILLDPNKPLNETQRNILKAARAELCKLVDQGPFMLHPMSESAEIINDINSDIEAMLGY